MNVRITPRDTPQRTELWGGIVGPVRSDGQYLILSRRPSPWRAPIGSPVLIPLKAVQELALDDDPGDW